MAHYKISDVAEEVKDRENNPSESKYDRFVGLEHYVSGDVEITHFGSTERLESAMKVFKAGDILIARRNVYLKRASTVSFDGLTSGDSIVLRAKDPTIARILPFVLNTDDFWDYADQYSDGTMSKRLSPKLLLAYEFDLPDDGLEDFADLLWAANETRNSYRELLRQTDELVKSQFIEMFGDIKEHIKLPLVEFGSIIEIGPQNGLYKSSKFYRLDQSGTPIVRVDSFYDGRVTDYSTLKRLDCSPEEISTYGLKDGDLVFNRVNGSVEHVGKCALISGLREETVFESNMMRVRIDPSKVDIGFLSTYLCSDIVRNQIKEKARVANQASVNQRDIRSILIPLPDIELQREYATFVRQSDKSKFVCSNRNLSRCLRVYSEASISR